MQMGEYNPLTPLLSYWCKVFINSLNNYYLLENLIDYL